MRPERNQTPTAATTLRSRPTAASALALQRAVGNRAVAALLQPAATPITVQRYSVINPNDYTLGAGSAFESQDTVVGGGTAKVTTSRREQSAGGGTLDTTKESAGGGVWNTTRDRVANHAALPSIKYATNGTDAIGIEDTTAEPKLFYATPSIVGPSNDALKAAMAEARLVDTGGSLDAPKDPASPAGPKLNLHAIKPQKQPGQALDVLGKFGGASECNQFIKNVVGELSERVAVFGSGAGHEALVTEEKEPTQQIASFAATGVGTAADLATHLGPTPRGEHDSPLPTGYTTMANKNARDATLGINAGAKAGVGEGYVITQNSPMPDEVTLQAWLTGFDRKLAGAHLTSAEIDMFKHKWGYHYAGIVAKVGDDAISLENYNRGTVREWAMDDLLNEQIAAVAGLRAELNRMAVAGANIPSIPKLRSAWFAKMLADLKALGDRADANQVASRNALNQVEAAMKGIEVSPESLWHFKMYGTGAGQSFHEQWAGSVDNPMTLRVRQSVDLAKARYSAQLDGATRQLVAEEPGPAAHAVMLRVLDLRAAIQNGHTVREIAVPYNTGVTLVYRAALTAMRGWAVDAANAAGVKRDRVPPVPSGVALAGYAQQLQQLVGNWERKGWAVTQSGKRRRVLLADVNRKIGLIAQLRV